MSTAPLQIEYSKTFLKQYYRLSPKFQKQFQSRLFLWQQNPYSPQLRVHMLTGQFAGKYSLNVTGDIRAIYEKVNETYVIFGFIGTHSQLYG